MDELIYSVRYIFQDYLKAHDCEYFNIPEYQRGYKWTADNVSQLLDDLAHFRKSTADSDEFYCLQNITITKVRAEGRCYYNVIDGQQRLTTLFIILSFVQRSFVGKIIPTDADLLHYSVRKSTNDFLRLQVLTGEVWNQAIDPNLAKSKDQYYIMEVAKAVSDWFDSHPAKIATTTLLDDLRLIVNEVDSGEEETVFASLNGGKVDLDGADLVRAILITRAAKQKYPTMVTHDRLSHVANDDINLRIDVSVSSQGKINEFRVKLGIELDKMNLWWHDGNVRNYFEQLLPNRIGGNRSFRYSDYPIDLLYYAFYEAYKDKLPKGGADLDLRFFENGIDLNHRPGDDHLEFYEALKEFHLTMVDWYSDDEIYNLVGYLMYNYKSNIITFGRLWSIWEGCRSKSEFKEKMKSLIRYELAIASSGDFDDSLEARLTTLNKVVNGEHVQDVEDRLVGLRQNILNTSSYDWYHDDFTIKFLPLLDILPFTLVVGGRKRTDIVRAKCNYLKRVNGEDKEHVRSQSRKIDEDNMTDEDRARLEEENRHGLNSIGNIVLLHESVNKSYHNDKLILKMVRIYSEHILDSESSYIRPHTFNVFMSKMKNMEGNGLSDSDFFWSDDDIRRTVEEIDASVADYLHLPNINQDNKE
jgi:hypothetical protein